MSADLLRRAAAKLRDALNADYLTPAPWDCLDGGDRLVHIEPPTGAIEYVVDEPMSNPSNAEYIALMHPPVALALADWLDEAAASWDRDDALAVRIEAHGHKRPEGWMERQFARPLAVARAVLREDGTDG